MSIHPKVISIRRFATLATAVFAATILLSGCGHRKPKHGTRFIIALDASAIPAGANHLRSLELLKDFLAKRAEQLHVPYNFRFEKNGHLIEEIGVVIPAQRDTALAAISTSKPIEFHLVHPNEPEPNNTATNPTGYKKMKIPLGTGVNVRTKTMLVKSAPEMVGHVLQAKAENGGADHQVVSIHFDDEGARLFETVTRRAMHHRLAIIVDGRVLSAPVIYEPISGGKCRIGGTYTATEAADLASVINVHPPVRFRVIEQQTY